MSDSENSLEATLQVRRNQLWWRPHLNTWKTAGGYRIVFLGWLNLRVWVRIW